MSATPERRARRLTRLYPRGWRERFGDEFEQLLIDEMSDRPRNTHRTADVIAHALQAHLTNAGLTGTGLDREVQAWRSLRVLGVVAAVFLAVSLGIWAQLSVAWSWASPAAPGTRVAAMTMTVALAGLVVVFALAAALALWPSVRSIRGPRQAWPILAIAACVAGLGIGCAHLASQWPGEPAGRALEHSVVPTTLARPAWASTLWLSAYWAHPSALGQRPGGELSWMVLSAVLLAILIVAGSLAVRSAAPGPRALRTLAALGAAGTALALLFFAGAATWILGSGPGPFGIFEPGTVDELSLGLLAIALTAAIHAGRRSLAVVRPSAHT